MTCFGRSTWATRKNPRIGIWRIILGIARERSANPSDTASVSLLDKDQGFLFPDTPIAVFAFEQLPFGETLETEGGNIHSIGSAIEHQLNKARARGRGCLEAGTAQPTGEIRPIQPRAL